MRKSFFKRLSVDFINKNVLYVDINRCGVKMTMEEAVKNYYTKSDCDKTRKRIDKYKKILKEKKVWAECCPMVLHYFNGKYYLGDGQGRWAAVQEIISEGIVDFEKQIPVHVIECDDFSEIYNDIILMNTNHTNWTASDVRRSNVIIQSNKGNNEGLKILNLLQYYQNELDVKGDFIPNMIVFGEQKASHRDSVIDKSVTSLLNPYHKSLFDFMKTILLSQYGTRNITMATKLKKQEVAIAVNSLFGSIVRNCEKDEKIYTSILKKISSVITDRINKLNDDEYIRLVSSKSTYIKTEFARYLKRQTDKRIKNALNEMLCNMNVNKAA